MQNKTNKNQKLEALITEIQELLYELKISVPIGTQLF